MRIYRLLEPGKRVKERMVRERWKDRSNNFRYLLSTRVGEICVIILFLSRDIVGLGHHLRSPTHRLTPPPSIRPKWDGGDDAHLNAIMRSRVFIHDIGNLWCWSRARNPPSRCLSMFKRWWPHFMDMLSTPTATPISISPLWIECTILRIAISPEEQSRLTVEMGTSCGMPAAMAAAREM